MSHLFQGVQMTSSPVTTLLFLPHSKWGWHHPSTEQVWTCEGRPLMVLIFKKKGSYTLRESQSNLKLYVSKMSSKKEIGHQMYELFLVYFCICWSGSKLFCYNKNQTTCLFLALDRLVSLFYDALLLHSCFTLYTHLTFHQNNMVSPLAQYSIIWSHMTV